MPGASSGVALRQRHILTLLYNAARTFRLSAAAPLALARPTPRAPASGRSCAVGKVGMADTGLGMGGTDQ